MNRRRIAAVLTALALTTGSIGYAQQTKTLVTFTTGSGSASEADRSQAMDEATQSAQNWANSSCIGMVTATNTVFSACTKIGSDEDGNATYSCSVTVNARCEVEYRGRSVELK